MSGPPSEPLHSRIAECGSQIELLNQQIARLHTAIAGRRGELPTTTATSLALSPPPDNEIPPIQEFIAPDERCDALARWIAAELRTRDAAQSAHLAARLQPYMDELGAKDAHVVALQNELAQTEAARRHWEAYSREVTRQLGSITSSRSWRIALRLQKLRHALVPTGGLAHRAFRKLKRLLTRNATTLAVSLPSAPLEPHVPSTVRSADFPPVDPAYERWIADNEPTTAQLDEQHHAAQNFAHRPLISVLTPLYNTPPEILLATIQSVQNQTYDRWELCLVDGGSTDPRVRQTLLAAAAADPRLRITLLATNGGISENTNAALGTARGEFVALLDHDDTLAPFALFEIVKRLNAEPGLDFLYSDKDLVSEDGTRRFWPLFKPGWSPELMLSANYLTHLNIIRTELARTVGGFRSEVDGAQDWDFFLRVTERTKKIAHVPHVLYHWRYWNKSVASGMQAKPYVLTAQKRTLEEHFARTGANVSISFEPDTNLHVRRATAPTLALSIIVTAREPSERLATLIASLQALPIGTPVDVLVVPDGENSAVRDTRFDHLEQSAPCRVVPAIRSETPGALLNRAAHMARGEALLFLDEAAEPMSADAVGELLLWIERENIGVTGGKLLRGDGTLDRGPLVVGLSGPAGTLFAGWPERTARLFGSCEWYRNCLAVSGACLMIRREVFDAAGGFDAAYHRGAGDIDLCLRVHALGYRNFYNPFARFRAHADLPAILDLDEHDRQRLVVRCRPFLKAGDPYFNVNLSRRFGEVAFRAADEDVALDGWDTPDNREPDQFESLRRAA